MKIRTSSDALYRHSKEKKPGFLWLLPYVLSIFLCVMLFAGTSWAWFESSVQVSKTITVANFQVTTAVEDEEGTYLYELPEGGYLLKGNTTYTVTFKAESTASEGYCIVKCGEKTYYTDQILHGDVMSFKMTPEDDVHCTITAMLGKCTEEQEIKNGAALGIKQ